MSPSCWDSDIFCIVSFLLSSLCNIQIQKLHLFFLFIGYNNWILFCFFFAGRGDVLSLNFNVQEIIIL